MASFGLFGSGGTWAKAPVLIISATPRAPAIIVKRRMYSSQGMYAGHAGFFAPADWVRQFHKLSPPVGARNTACAK